jgi:sugar lactone lactonase YvrE
LALFTFNFGRAATGTATVGQTVTFSVTADGTTPFAYQWTRNAANIAGARAATYVISSAQLTDAAIYRVVVSNSAGSTTSDRAILTVKRPRSSALAQGSTISNGITLEVTTAPATMIMPASTTVSATAQVYAINVTSNPRWTASSSQPWATVSPASGGNNGTVTVTVAANTSAGSRNAIITVGGQTNTLTQTGAGTVVITLPLTVTTLAGYPLSKGSIDGIGSSARFYYPTGIAADNAGNLYVSDTDNNAVRRIVASTGEVTTTAGLAASPGSTDGIGNAALFSKPSGVAVENVGVAIDSEGNVFVADTLNHTLRRITSLHAVSTIAGTAGQSGYVDEAGAAARFQGPQGLAFCRVASATGTESDLYIADTNNQTIRKINLSNGLVTTVAGLAGESGSSDGMSGSARFNSPTDVAVDNNGNLFVADSENHTIREILPSGLVSTLAGQALASGSADGVGTAARFHSPSAVAVDLSHNVYVADTANNTIRMIIPLTGVVSTLAGLAGASGTADGLGSAVRFYNPTGITVDSTGNLYVSDTNNHTIRVGLLPSMPSVQTQPQSLSVAMENNAQFSVTATGRPAVTYQWYFNGAAITGATGSTYSLSSAQSGNAGNYTVVVSNLVGFVTSSQATLTVGAAQTSGASSNDGGGSSGSGGGAGSAPGM